MQAIAQMNSQPKDRYGLKLIVYFMIFIFLIAYTSFYLMQNFYSKSVLEYSFNGKNIYFLKSATLVKMYENNGMDYNAYEQRVTKFKQLCKENGYKFSDVTSEELLRLRKNSIVFALDMMSLSADEIHEIETFVQGGGKLLLNFTSGFIDESAQYTQDNLVKRITGLTLNEKINTMKFDENNSIFLTTKLMSPFAKYLPEGKALDILLYDPLPLFKTPKGVEIDSYLTNWSQTDYPRTIDAKELAEDESGAIWHGSKGKGKWVFFSFPSYVFVDVSIDKFIKLFQGMLESLDKDIDVIPYTYIDATNSIFVSEDTEYKYENLEKFYAISVKHNFPVTAFCVADLATQDAEMMKRISKKEFFEIGSHSYTHEKIVGESEEVYEKETIGAKKELDKLTKQNIIGFRAPREEIDDKMIDLLQEGGFKYALTIGENILAPTYKKGFMLIPRHATDDYSFLINLDWNAEQILQKMIHEAKVLTALNGMYTMSTHTHLMNFGSNIKITDDFFAYVNTQKQMTPMNGKMLYERLKQSSNLKLTTEITGKKVVLSITNSNNVEVKNMKYEILVHPSITIKDIESEVFGVKTELEKVSADKYILTVLSLSPRSQVVLFANYVQNH